MPIQNKKSVIYVLIIIVFLSIALHLNGCSSRIIKKERIDETSISTKSKSALDKIQTKEKILNNVIINPQTCNPSLGDSVQLSYRLTKPAKVTIHFIDEDGFIVRRLIDKKDRTSNTMHNEIWDGKDDSGVIVPDEVYYPVITVNTQNREEIYNPLLNNGGIDIEATHVQYDKRNQNVSYKLDQHSRVLVRIGLRKGVLLQTLVDWQPRVAGTVSEYWNGYDSDTLQEVLKLGDNIAMVIFGYTLPKPFIICYGNKALSWREYRMVKDTVQTKRIIINNSIREDKNISKHFYQSRFYDHAPKIHITFPHNTEKDSAGVPILKDKALVHVEIDSVDVQFLDEQYEITFFIDNEFFVEEEVGYTPYNWLWRVNALDEGYHILTVNIASFKDRVGTKSVLVRVEK